MVLLVVRRRPVRLPEPHGTCYLALEPVGAFLEVFRDTTMIPRAEVDARRLSAVVVDESSLPIADFAAAAARGFGVTAAVGASPDYPLCQAWAKAAVAGGYGAIRYGVSHDPSGRQRGLALFGSHGAQPGRPVLSTEPLLAGLIREARERFGLHVLG